MWIGIDFATGSGETWLAAGEERSGQLVLTALDRVANEEIPARIEGARVVGMDVPLGWPDAFQEAMRHHRADRPRALAAAFPARLTDVRVAKELRLTPLSVAADLIGRCAWQAARILAQWPHCVNPVEPVSEPCVLEVYPKAALKVLAGEKRFGELKRYKSGEGQRGCRERIADEILRAERFREVMVESHDALDAVLALHCAWAFAKGEVEFPAEDEKEQASREGWIYYPSAFEGAVQAIVEGEAARLQGWLAAWPELVRQRSKKEHRSTLLHYVSANGVEQEKQKTPANIVEITRILLDAGADVNAESEAYGGGSDTLMLTGTSVHPERAGVQIELMELLLERGARIKPGAVRACLANGRGRAAEFLAARGAELTAAEAAGVGKIVAVDARDMADALGWACQFGRREVVEALLRQNPALEALDIGLHYAAHAGDPELVKMLLRAGAPKDRRDARFDGTPLDWADHARRNGGRGEFDEVMRLLQ